MPESDIIDCSTGTLFIPASYRHVERGRAEEVRCQSRGTKEHTEGASDCAESLQKITMVLCETNRVVMKFVVSCLPRR